MTATGDRERALDSLAKICQARAGGAVERCHAFRHLGSYSNAAHSWGVAMLILQLFPEHFERLAAVALCHDVGEFIVGDIPAGVLRRNPELRFAVKGAEAAVLEGLDLPTEHNLTEQEELVLRTCDRLDFYLWAREQRSIGNTFVNEFVQASAEALEKPPTPPIVRELIRCSRSHTLRPAAIPVLDAVLGPSRGFGG